MKAVSKVARVVGVVAGVAAAAVTGGASLGISASLLSTISFGATALGSVAGSLAKAKPIERSVIGSITDFRYNPNAGVPIAVGRTYFAGIPVHRDGYPNDADPTPNPYLTYAIEFSGAGPIGGLENFYADREVETFSAGAATGKFAGYMWLDWQDGQVNEPTALSPPFAGMEGWDANSKASGHAMALWTLKYDAQDREGRMYQQGEPEPGAVLTGVLCYDPRKDDTYPGGSGAHRWADPSDTAAHDAARATWEVSYDPFINGLNHALGTWHRDMDNPASQYVKVRGAGEPIAAIDVAAFVEGANVCQANGWTLGGMYSALDPKWGVLKAMLACGGGEPIMTGGLLSCLVETPRVSLATVSEDQIVGETRPPGMNPRRGRPNSYIPRYWSEAHGWKQVSAPAVTIDAYVTAEGRLVQEALPFLFGQDARQVSQLTYYQLVNQRELPISTMLRPRWVGYKPGDCVTLEWPNIGYASQKVIIQERRFDPLNMRVGMDLKTETDAKHPAALALDPDPPAAPSLSSTDFRTVPTPPASDWTVTGETLSSPSGSIPALVAAGAVSNTNIAHVVFEYRVDGETTWIMEGIADASIERQEFPTVTPGTDYEVAISYVHRNGSISARRVLGPVTTGNLVAGEAGAVEWDNVQDGSGTKPADNATRNTGAANADGLEAIDAGGPLFVGQLPGSKASPELLNSGIVLNSDGTASYWDGTSFVNIGAVTFPNLIGVPGSFGHGLLRKEYRVFDETLYPQHIGLTRASIVGGSIANPYTGNDALRFSADSGGTSSLIAYAFSNTNYNQFLPGGQRYVLDLHNRFDDGAQTDSQWRIELRRGSDGAIAWSSDFSTASFNGQLEIDLSGQADEFYVLRYRIFNAAGLVDGSCTIRTFFCDIYPKVGNTLSAPPRDPGNWQAFVIAATVEENADVTMLVEGGATETSLEYDYTGAIKANQTKKFYYKMKRGGAFLTSGVTGSAVVKSGSASISPSVTEGVLELIVSGVTANAVIEVTLTYNGTDRKGSPLTANRVQDAPPATGGGGVIVSTTNIAASTTTFYPATPNAIVGPIECPASGDFIIRFPGALNRIASLIGTTGALAKVVYRLAGTSSWTDLPGSETADSIPAETTFDPEFGSFDQISGTLTLNASPTSGFTVGEEYEFGLLLLKQDDSGGVSTIGWSGTYSVEQD